LGAGLPREEVEDLKIDISEEDLKGMIGDQEFDKLRAMFSAKIDEIVIRRCESHGKLINFHTDVSKKTMQVAISSDTEYTGGTLLYATRGQLHMPKRAQGTVTIHDNTIVHGVTLFESGIRYALFFLNKS
jgi:predicted 2-oxoglutarate/Fe(II)-dependent dioxygenase YbiX